MQGVCLKFFVTEAQRHNGTLLYEWLLEQAKKLGIPGGSVFRATAGYGRHGKLHEETFFELAGDLPLELEFVLNETQAEALLKLVRSENLKLFHVSFPVHFGLTG
jgi:PII-like signaling protein